MGWKAKKPMVWQGDSTVAQQGGRGTENFAQLPQKCVTILRLQRRLQAIMQTDATQP